MKRDRAGNHLRHISLVIVSGILASCGFQGKAKVPLDTALPPAVAGSLQPGQPYAGVHLEDVPQWMLYERRLSFLVGEVIPMRIRPAFPPGPCEGHYTLSYPEGAFRIWQGPARQGLVRPGQTFSAEGARLYLEAVGVKAGAVNVTFEK